jgi:hypothetical protein
MSYNNKLHLNSLGKRVRSFLVVLINKSIILLDLIGLFLLFKKILPFFHLILKGGLGLIHGETL